MFNEACPAGERPAFKTIVECGYTPLTDQKFFSNNANITRSLLIRGDPDASACARRRVSSEPPAAA